MINTVRRIAILLNSLNVQDCIIGHNPAHQYKIDYDYKNTDTWEFHLEDLADWGGYVSCTNSYTHIHTYLPIQTCICNCMLVFNFAQDNLLSHFLQKMSSLVFFFLFVLAAKCYLATHIFKCLTFMLLCSCTRITCLCDLFKCSLSRSHWSESFAIRKKVSAVKLLSVQLCYCRVTVFIFWSIWNGNFRSKWIAITLEIRTPNNSIS